MNIDACIKKVINDIKMQKKESILEIGDSNKTIEQIISSYPKALYYISNIERGYYYGDVIKTKISYHNLSCPTTKLYVISTKEQFISALKYNIASFQSHIVTIIKTNINVDEAITSLYEKYAPFFPAFKTLHFSGISHIISEFYVYDVVIEYKIGKVKLKTMELEVEKELTRLSRLLFLKDMPDYIKVYIAHNYLATNVEYYLPKERTQLENNYIHSAYGALINKKCVCQGYADAFKRLMSKNGVRCDIVCGRVEGGYHAWNMVVIDNKSYHVDVTWDAGKKPRYVYFCKDDSFMKSQRTWYKEYTGKCYTISNIEKKAKDYIKNIKHKLKNRGISDMVLDC